VLFLEPWSKVMFISSDGGRGRGVCGNVEFLIVEIGRIIEECVVKNIKN